MCHTLPDVQRFFSGAASLPAMPEVAQRLLSCFRDPALTLATLQAVVATDAALSARLLRLANSARYSPRQRVTRLDQAAAIIGLDAMRGLSLAACLVDQFPQPHGFDRLRFWCQNLGTAGYARTLAEQIDEDGDVAEIAGLMLRSGELLMLIHQPGLTALIEELAGPPDSVFEVERLNFGVTHAEVSAELAVRWRFPPEVVDAIYTAADPLAARPYSPMGALVRAASVMADAASDGADPLLSLQQTQPLLLQRLGLHPDAVTQALPNWSRLTAAVLDLIG